MQNEGISLTKNALGLKMFSHFVFCNPSCTVKSTRTLQNLQIIVNQSIVPAVWMINGSLDIVDELW